MTSKPLSWGCLGAACAPWQAHGWKRLVNDTVRQHWFKGLMAGAGGKSSLCWLDVQLCQLGKPHPLWLRGAAVHVLESQQDLPHFLIECPSLQDARKRHMELIVKSLKEDGVPLPSGTDNWCYFILNCGANYVWNFNSWWERHCNFN